MSIEMYSSVTNVGTRLRERRLAMGLTQRQLETESGISRHEVSRYEGGRRTPRLQTIARLARALGVSVDDLLG